MKIKRAVPIHRLQSMNFGSIQSTAFQKNYFTDRQMTKDRPSTNILLIGYFSVLFISETAPL